jgi:hypothetical protein
MSMLRKITLGIALSTALLPTSAPAAPTQLLNVSYDPFFLVRKFDQRFAAS